MVTLLMGVYGGNGHQREIDRYAFQIFTIKLSDFSKYKMLISSPCETHHGLTIFKWLSHFSKWKNVI